MSLKPSTVQSIPEDTLRVARAAFPHGNAYQRRRWPGENGPPLRVAGPWPARSPCASCKRDDIRPCSSHFGVAQRLHEGEV
jgi:hypothetical protein